MRAIDRKYLLRVWKDGQGESAWRASLKELHSEQVTYFNAPEQLASFIRQQTASEAAAQ